MKIRADLKINVLEFLILFVALRPTFYFISPYIARVSDFTVLFLTFLLVARINLIHRAYVSWLLPYIFYLFVIVISLVYFTLTNGNLIFLDLVELSRPFFIIFIMALGFMCVHHMEEKDIVRILNMFIFIAIINSILGLLMYLFKDNLKFLYVIYNVPNLYFHGRPGGLAYTHTEYAAINLLGICSFLIRKRVFEQRFSYFIFLFIIFASFVPQSKAGVLLIFLFLITYSLIVVRKIFLFATMLLLIGGLYVLQDEIRNILMNAVPLIYFGFVALFSLIKDTSNITDGSVGPRFEDWLITFRIARDQVSALLIGNSPMRYHPEVSYIENSMTNVLFRFGLLGLICYYWNFVRLIISFPTKSPELVSLSFSIIISDMTANISESVKFMMLLSIFISVTIGWVSRHGRAQIYPQASSI